jgi:hypothetical protein
MHCAFWLRVACGRSETGLSPCCCRSTWLSAFRCARDRHYRHGHADRHRADDALVGWIANRHSRRLLVLAAAALMINFQKVRPPEEAGVAAD